MSNSLALTKKKFKMESLLKDMETEGNPKNTAIETLVTAGVAVGGSQLGRMIGRPSFLVGLAAVGYGLYKRSNRATILGASMIAGGGFATLNGLDGSKTVTEKINSSVKNIGADLKHRLYLDKLFKPKTTEAAPATTNGLGNIEYFKYPKQQKTEVGALEGGELDLGALDAIEEEIARSSEAMQKSQVSGYEDVAGYEDIAGVEERIY